MGEVYYGGVTRKEDNELVQYRILCRCKNRNLLDFIQNWIIKSWSSSSFWRVIRYFIEVGKKRIQWKPKQEQLIKTLTQMKGTSGHEGRIR